jgi:hypothetical protein
MNPIIYFDELDKVANGEYGQDIYVVLSNLTEFLLELILIF